MQDDELAELLIERGANVNKGCRDFASPLHLAASQGTTSLIKLLLSHNAVIDTADDQGWTPLMLATRGGKVGAVKMLEAAGANKEKANAQGNTAFHLAAANGRRDVCVALMGGSVMGKVPLNGEGKSPADLARTPEIAALFADESAAGA
jgi:ankyrin repeat protein